MRSYFNVSFLEAEIKKNSSLIYKALLKYGYSNFSLEIFEYCDADQTIHREQYYLDFFKPDYNLLKKAGSSFGFKHSEETKAKFRARRYTDEQKAERLKKLKIHNENPEQKERLNRIHAIQSKKLQVFNNLNNETTVYSSISEAAKVLGIYQASISLYLKNKSTKPFKGKYIFKLV